MSKDYLGEFEELVLLVIALLGDDAYGLGVRDEIKEQTGRSTTIGAVHATIARLEKKGFVETYIGGASHARGGRRKRLIQLTQTGKSVLAKSRETKIKLWDQIPDIVTQGN